MHRVCWPWCVHRKARRAILREIASINWVEAHGGWIPASEAWRRERLYDDLEMLDA